MIWAWWRHRGYRPCIVLSVGFFDTPFFAHFSVRNAPPPSFKRAKGDFWRVSFTHKKALTLEDFIYSCIWWLSTSFEYGKVVESISRLPLWSKSHTDLKHIKILVIHGLESYYWSDLELLFWIQNLGCTALQPAYNRSNIPILLLSCSNLRTYNTFS